MKIYRAILTYEDDRWIAEIPELPGARAAGLFPDVARKRLRDLLFARHEFGAASAKFEEDVRIPEHATALAKTARRTWERLVAAEVANEAAMRAAVDVLYEQMGLSQMVTAKLIGVPEKFVVRAITAARREAQAASGTG